MTVSEAVSTNRLLSSGSTSCTEGVITTLSASLNTTQPSETIIRASVDIGKALSLDFKKASIELTWL